MMTILVIVDDDASCDGGVGWQQRLTAMTMIVDDCNNRDDRW